MHTGIMHFPPDPELIPEHLREGIDTFVEHGQIPGSFLEAVLQNDLKESIGRADEGSMATLIHTVAYCYQKIPTQCWGSKKAVQAWSDLGGMAGYRRERAGL